MTLTKELDQAQRFYIRARKEQDKREMARQAREIKILAARLAVVLKGGMNNDQVCDS